MSHSRLSPEERYRIWFLYDESGLDYSQIASETGHHYNTVKHWIEHYKVEKEMEDKARSGAPRKSTPEEDSYMVSRANRDDWTAPQIQSGLQRKHHKQVSVKTIQNRLRAAGLRYKSTKVKSPLKPEHCKERLRFSLRSKGRRWDRILFTDYAKYELGSRKRFAWTRTGERKFAERKVHPPNFNFWLSFGRSGPGVLHMFDENLTGDMHVDIILKYAPKAARKLFSGKWYLLTDNDPKTVTRDRLKKLENANIDRLSFPRYSNELNVSENIINIVKNNTAERNPENIAQAKKYLKEEFENLPLDIFQGLVDSMDDRCQAVIDAKGGYTDY
jgi:transposase